MITTLLITDHSLVREAIATVLERDGEISIAGQCSTSCAGIQAFEELRPDVVLMDIDLPDGSGLETTERIIQGHPEARIVILTLHDSIVYPYRALKHGAKGCMTRNCLVTDLFQAIHSAAVGEVYLSPKVAQKLAVHNVNGGLDPYDVLPPREFDIFLYLAQGLNVTEIADRLCLSPKTVGASRTRIMKRLKSDNVATLAHIAIRFGLISV